MKKKIVALLFLAFSIMFIVGCREGVSNEGLGSRGASVRPFNVGVVLTRAEKGLPSNVATMFLPGIKKAEEELGLVYKVLNPGDLVNDDESLGYFAENEYDLIIAAGPNASKAVSKAASNYTDINFVVMDNVIDKPNVTSMIFNDEHGGFLAGFIAGSLTKTGTVGFIGGSQLDEAARRYESGFLRGVQYVNNSEGKKIKVFVSYAGIFADAEFKPEKGKTLAQAQYGNGADIIFQVAGQTGSGVYQAAKEAKKFVISNNSKMNESEPWNSYGVVVKKMDMALYNVVKDAFQKKLKSGVIMLGVDNAAIDFHPSSLITPEVADKLKVVKVNLAKGIIQLDKLILAPDLKQKVPEVVDPTPGQVPVTPAEPGQTTGTPARPNDGATRPQPARPAEPAQPAEPQQPEGQQPENPDENPNTGTTDGTGNQQPTQPADPTQTPAQ